MDDTQHSEENIVPKLFSSDISFGNLPKSFLKQTHLPTFEQQKLPNFKAYPSGGNSIKESRSPIYKEESDKENIASNVNGHFVKRLSSSYVTHKVIDLVSTNVENSFFTNNSSEPLNKSVLNTPMYFGTDNSTVVATQIGATAHIPCIVHHMAECVDWTLQIKFVQQRDAGIYECQVSTHPPTSIFLHLLVVEARAEISGPNIRYLTPGSTLRLQCHVVENTENSEYIFWYHDNRMINYDADRGINVSTEPDFQSSELTISRTRREHSGNYTCVASNTQPASVLVHIFKGDNPAAMYHGHVGSSTKSYQTYLLHIIMAMIAVVYRTYVKRKIM